MQSPVLKVLIFCAVTAAIILFCVVFGGYSSFYRSQNRIEESKNILVESCRERLALLPAVSDFLKKINMDTPSSVDQSIAKAESVLTAVFQQKSPLEEQTTKDFEASQVHLTIEIKKILDGLKDVFDPESRKEFNSLKERVFKDQDDLYMAGDRYNYEVSYFNERVKSFPVSLIARLFGFHRITYYPFSEQAFPPARKAFE
ncbi:MAG: LemA family protein [Desulfobacula sp.]|jgi:LemA protein